MRYLILAAGLIILVIWAVVWIILTIWAVVWIFQNYVG